MKVHNQITRWFGRAFGFELQFRRLIGDKNYNSIFGWLKTDLEKESWAWWKIESARIDKLREEAKALGYFHWFYGLEELA